MHRATKLSIIIVVVAVAVIIISYCLKFVCLQFSSAEFIYALGEEEKKPMYAICSTPSLRSFLNVAFKTVSMFVSLFRLFKEDCRAENPLSRENRKMFFVPVSL